MNILMSAMLNVSFSFIIISLVIPLQISCLKADWTHWHRSQLHKSSSEFRQALKDFQHGLTRTLALTATTFHNGIEIVAKMKTTPNRLFRSILRLGCRFGRQSVLVITERKFEFITSDWMHELRTKFRGIAIVYASGNETNNIIHEYLRKELNPLQIVLLDQCNAEPLFNSPLYNKYYPQTVIIIGEHLPRGRIALQEKHNIFILRINIQQLINNPMSVQQLQLYKIHMDSNKLVAIPFSYFEPDHSINAWPKDMGRKYYGYFNILKNANVSIVHNSESKDTIHTYIMYVAQFLNARVYNKPHDPSDHSVFIHSTLHLVPRLRDPSKFQLHWDGRALFRMWTDNVALIAVKQPQSMTIYTLIKCFHYKIWLAVFISIGLSHILFVLVFIKSPTAQRSKYTRSWKYNKVVLFISMHASDHTFSCMSSKVLQLFTAIVIFLLLNIYLAFYTTALANLTDKIPYNSLPGFLLSAKKYNVAMHEASILPDIISDCAQYIEGFIGFEYDDLRRTDIGYYAMSSDTVRIDMRRFASEFTKGNCSIGIAMQKPCQVDITLSFGVTFPYTELFYIMLMRLNENGIFHMLHIRYDMLPDVCQNKLPSPITLNLVWILLVFLCGSWVLTVVIFFCERFKRI